MANKFRLALLHSTIREDEKLIIEAARNSVELTVLDARDCMFNPDSWDRNFDAVLQRCISSTVGRIAILFFERIGMRVVNSSAVSDNCENKFLTSLILRENEIPTVPFALAFTEAQAKEAIEGLGGYPVVLKPVSGSWGRLLAKINDEDALEAVIEQKMVLGSPLQKVLYLQKFVEKPGRDIRAVIINNQVLCAIFRQTDHWISNTARGAVAKNCKIDTELEKICTQASKAVGGGILGIDVFETDSGYVINEINHTMEFKNVQRTTGINVASEIINFCRRQL